MYKQAIEETRGKYKPPKRGYHRISPPLWLMQCALSNCIKDNSFLTKFGKIVYGCIVQANSKIFKKSFKYDPCLPALLIYSLEPYYNENPDELKKIATYLFSYKNKNKNNAPEDIKDAVSIVTDEYSTRQNVLLPKRLCPHGDIYITIFVIWRYHLPKNHLRGKLLPILVSPTNVDSVMIVPKKYWGDQLKHYYTKGYFKKVNG